MVTTRGGKNIADAAPESLSGNGSNKTNKITTSSAETQMHSSSPGLLRLSVELRLHIYSHLVVSDRPFLIGRCQDDTKRKHEGSPRDLYPGRHDVERDDRPSLPIQPPITRVCRQIREESLPVFYGENRFWLIHNEFKPDEGSTQRRAFHGWLELTPTKMFDIMQNVFLCGYQHWPTRVMITLNLKARELTAVRKYSTYGDELEVWQPFVDSIKEVLQDAKARNGLAALKAVLAKVDWIYELKKEHVSAPPGLSRLRKPQSGPDYDF